MQTTPRRADATPTEPRAPSPFFRYRFANVDFDESVGTLSVAGVAVVIEPRPRELLSELLRRPNEVVAREELLEALWQGRPTVDNVLANAVTKLRKALGPEGAERLINIPRVGYRLAGPIERVAVGEHAGDLPLFTAGELVPGRVAYRLEAPLGRSAATALVWRARDPKLQETRIFKFAADGERLTALKREYTLYRVLRAELGERDDFARVLGANFTTAPYFIECEDGGPDLLTWADEGDRLAQLSTGERLALFLKIARAVAAAHGVGVLHKDLKPANVLVTEGADGRWAKLTDFGSSRLLDPGRLAALGVTAMGLTVTHGINSNSPGGTPLYLAPELIAGRSPTTQSDLYALGLMLYQMVVGDLRRPMSTGWQREIDDALLAGDIAAATEGRPEDRLGSVAELVERLETLEARRTVATEAAEASRRAEALLAEAARRRARRPWVVAAFVALTLGLVASLWSYRRSQVFLREARDAAEEAQRVTDFLHRDLLDAPDIVIANNTGRMPTILEMMRRASAAAIARFKDQPRAQAVLHRRLAETYMRMASLVDAGEALDRAIALLTPQVPPDDVELLICRFLRARLLVWTQGHARAEDELSATERMASAHLQGDDEVAYHGVRARYAYAMDRDDGAAAVPLARRLVVLADGLFPAGAPAAADARQLLAEAEYRVGSIADAQAHLAELVGPPYFRLHAAADAEARDLFSRTNRAAVAMVTRGDYAGAERAWIDARSKVAKISAGSGAFDFAWIDLLLGCVYAAQGKWQAAHEIFGAAASGFERLLGAGHQYVRTSQLLLAMTETALGRPDAALSLYDGVAIWRQQHTGYWPWARLTSFGRAAALTRSDRPAEALSALATLSAGDFDRIPYQNAWAARIDAEKGVAMIALGRGEEGQALLRQAVEAMTAAHGWPSLTAQYRAVLAVRSPGAAMETGAAGSVAAPASR